MIQCSQEILLALVLVMLFIFGGLLGFGKYAKGNTILSGRKAAGNILVHGVLSAGIGAVMGSWWVAYGPGKLDVGAISAMFGAAVAGVLIGNDRLTTVVMTALSILSEFLHKKLGIEPKKTDDPLAAYKNILPIEDIAQAIEEYRLKKEEARLYLESLDETESQRNRLQHLLNTGEFTLEELQQSRRRNANDGK